MSFNLKFEQTKDSINRVTQKKIKYGVYALVDRDRSKIIYVGQSKNLTARLKTHYYELRKGIHKRFQDIWDHNKNGFEVIILFASKEAVDPMTLKSIETYWIGFLRTYTLMYGGDGRNDVIHDLNALQEGIRDEGELLIKKLEIEPIRKFMCLSKLRDYDFDISIGHGFDSRIVSKVQFELLPDKFRFFLNNQEEYTVPLKDVRKAVCIWAYQRKLILRMTNEEDKSRSYEVWILAKKRAV